MKKRCLLLGMFLFCIVIAIFVTNMIYLSQNTKQDEVLVNFSKEDVIEEILNNDNLFDLGGHIIAYRVSNDRDMNSIYGIDGNFGGDYYIAIRDINTNEYRSTCDNIYYLPDIYENILEMNFEETNSLYIKYRIIGSDKVEETRIPIFFPDKLKDGFIEIKSADTYNAKCILDGQVGLQGGESVFPQTIWTEYFEYKGQIYEVAFERVSLIYLFPMETEGYYADYCLKVKDEQGNVISEQMIINFPVKYEEVYWNIDFSGNGFKDIAFCTDMYAVSKYGWTELTTFVWNYEKNLYEKKEFPIYGEIKERWWNMQLWNQELSSVISFVGRTERGDAVMERYMLSNGAWICVGRLEPFYDENNTDELQYIGYQELNFSMEGKLVDRNVLTESEAVWLNEDSIWSRYNTDNTQLYPCDPVWKEIQISIGKINVRKFVRVN